MLRRPDGLIVVLLLPCLPLVILMLRCLPLAILLLPVRCCCCRSATYLPVPVPRYMLHVRAYLLACM